MFVASIIKIKTIDKDVLDSEWALTSCAFTLFRTFGVLFTKTRYINSLLLQVGLHQSTDKNVCIVL